MSLLNGCKISIFNGHKKLELENGSRNLYFGLSKKLHLNKRIIFFLKGDHKFLIPYGENIILISII